MWILRKIIHPMGEIDAMEFYQQTGNDQNER